MSPHHLPATALGFAFLSQPLRAADFVHEVAPILKENAYEPPLKLRRQALPAAVDGRDQPLDRILDATIFTAMGISPKTAFDVEQRPFYTALDGKGKAVESIFA